jgi:hypothetical protein
LGGCSKERFGKRAATNELCILGDKGAILTALGNTAHSETLVVVASTDEHGAAVVEKHIREQLERSDYSGDWVLPGLRLVRTSSCQSNGTS